MGLKELVAEKRRSCAVALYSECNNATNLKTHTEECNTVCNSNATQSIKVLENIDSSCNYIHNGQATEVLNSHTTSKQSNTTNVAYKSTSFEDRTNAKIIQNQSDKYVISANDNNCLVWCFSCQYLSATSFCSQIYNRVIPHALRQCEYYVGDVDKRATVDYQPYTQQELDGLLRQSAIPLVEHLVNCHCCSLEDARYGRAIQEIASKFEDILLCFEDAANKRYLLMNYIIALRCKY